MDIATTLGAESHLAPDFKACDCKLVPLSLWVLQEGYEAVAGDISPVKINRSAVNMICPALYHISAYLCGRSIKMRGSGAACAARFPAMAGKPHLLLDSSRITYSSLSAGVTCIESVCGFKE